MPNEHPGVTVSLMKLYLLRHADAEAGSPDSARRLTKKGEDQVRQLARFLKKNEFAGLVEIRHSALTRAVQTARLFKDGLSLNVPLVVSDALRPEDDPRVIARELAAIDGDIMLVGHNPYMETMASLLLGAPAGNSLVEFKKAGLLCLERLTPTRADPGHLPVGDWLLAWYVIPRLL